MSATTQDKVIATIKSDLASGDDKKILAALKRVKSKGDASVIKPMIALYEETYNDEIKAEIKSLLSQIKVKNALVEIIESLVDGSDEVNEMLLFAIWNANLTPDDYLAEVIEASCKGNYMVALEGLTVVENLDGPFKEEVINDAKLVLNEYFNNEDEKVDLIKSILGLVRSFDNSIEG